jgi:hypothetical protein
MLAEEMPRFARKRFSKRKGVWCHMLKVVTEGNFERESLE